MPLCILLMHAAYKTKYNINSVKGAQKKIYILFFLTKIQDNLSAVLPTLAILRPNCTQIGNTEMKAIPSLSSFLHSSIILTDANSITICFM